MTERPSMAEACGVATKSAEDLQRIIKEIERVMPTLRRALPFDGGAEVLIDLGNTRDRLTQSADRMAQLIKYDAKARAE